MNVSPATAGKVYLTVTGVLFAYYTVWVLVLPFVPEEFTLVKTRFFPPVELALGLPALLGTVVIVALFLRTWYLVREDRARDVKID